MLGRPLSEQVYEPAKISRAVTGGVSAVSQKEHLGEQCGGNTNYFAYLTSGFHSVNESYMLEKCNNVLEPANPAAVAYFYSSDAHELTFLDLVVRSGELTRDYDDLMSAFRAAFFGKDMKQQDHIEHVIFLRKIAEVWNIALTLGVVALSSSLKERVLWLKEEYLATHSPGDSIPR